MALISCPECEAKVSELAISCPQCGCPIAEPEPQDLHVTAPRSRGVHIILGLLFGAIGFHNFYSGHNGRGAFKLIVFSITFLLDLSTGFNTGFCLVAAVFLGLCALIEIIFVGRDGHGYPMV